MNKLVLWFVKITGLPMEAVYFHKKIYYENKKNSNRRIKGGALIVSNHMSIYDYPLMMYTFFNRSIRTLAAEILYGKSKWFSRFIKNLGCIKVDRHSYDFSFMSAMINCLKKKQVGLVYPEARLVNENEDYFTFRDFKPSYVYMALEANVPIIPVYTNGIYGKDRKKYKTRTKVMIGEKIYPHELLNDKLSEKENISFINDYVKNKILGLKEKVEGCK